MTRETRPRAGAYRTARLRRYLPIYGLIALPLLWYLVYQYIPLAGSIIAFQKTNPYEGVSGMLRAPFVGLYWFERFFSSYYFGNLMRNTLLISAKKLLLGFPAAILFALLLNELRSRRFKSLVQTVSYMPHFLSAVVVSGLVITLLSPDGGVVNSLIVLCGGQPVYFLGKANYFQGIIVLSSVWQEIGWNSIIYLAAIAGLDPALYEAAVMDGAGRLRQVVSITLPGILSIVVVLFIMQIGSILNAGFEQIVLLYSPAVYSTADIIDTYVYREGLINLNYSYATAIGLFKSVFALLLILLANWLAHRVGEMGIW